MSTETTDRCAVCTCFLDSEDLFCANCGTENPHADSVALQHFASYRDLYSYDCQGCGASMSYDASAQSLRCPFCGSTAMTKQESRLSIQCDWVVPLAVDVDKANNIFRQWLGSGFWRPNDAVEASQVGKFSAVYVPFWVFEAYADTKWTADSSPAPAGCRGDWYPLSGENRARYKQILVGASSILTPAEVSAIEPYEFQQAVEPGQVDLKNAIVELFRLPRKSARPIAQSIIEERERQVCTKYVPGRARRVKVNVRIHGMMGRPVLLPVWILAYHYKEEVHRVLINGQTGKISGSAPFSMWKLAIVLATVVVLIILGSIIAALASQ
jgi:DNA-directed RNA polymerase subunit RPC12/RpoP